MKTATAVRERAPDTIERAYSLLTIKAVDDDGEARIIRGIATTPETDRYGDIVEPLGVTFENPLPLLHQHDTKRPVGTVTLHKPTKDGITFEAKFAKIAEPGELKNRIDLAWGETKSGLTPGVSIGFRPIETSRLDNGGIRFLKSEILELSLVTVRANAGAVITEIRSIDRAQRAALGQERGTVVALNRPGASGKPIPAKEAIPVTKKSIAELIRDFGTTRGAKFARMEAIMAESGEKGETLDAQQQEEYDAAHREVKAIDDHLVRLHAMEKNALATARPVQGETEDEGTQSRARPYGTVQVRNTKLPPGVGFVRMLQAKYISMKDNCSQADVGIERGWGEDFIALLKAPRMIQRAAVAAATTTDATWAGPLVIAQNLTGEFIEIIRAAEIISRIPGLHRMPFNVRVPRQTADAIAYWVAEGAPKPVSKAAFDTISLGFNKVAGITLMTDELMRFSTPAAEGLLVKSLTAAIVKLIDRDFLDPAKAAVAGTSPASITNGVAAIPATGTTGDAFRTDMGTALAGFTAAGLGVRDLVMVMRETQALQLGLIRNSLTGQFDFPNMGSTGGNINGIPVVASENVVAGSIVLISAPNIFLADEGGVEVDISTEATVQASDAPDNPVLATTVAISLWQQNMVGIRCERYVTWSKAMAGAVAHISGANYH